MTTMTTAMTTTATVSPPHCKAASTREAAFALLFHLTKNSA
jgi:hypothetical protein